MKIGETDFLIDVYYHKKAQFNLKKKWGEDTHTPSELKRSLSENARETEHTPSILGICRLQK